MTEVGLIDEMDLDAASDEDEETLSLPGVRKGRRNLGIYIHHFNSFL